MQAGEPEGPALAAANGAAAPVPAAPPTPGAKASALARPLAPGAGGGAAAAAGAGASVSDDGGSGSQHGAATPLGVAPPPAALTHSSSCRSSGSVHSHSHALAPAQLQHADHAGAGAGGTGAPGGCGWPRGGVGASLRFVAASATAARAAFYGSPSARTPLRTWHPHMLRAVGGWACMCVRRAGESLEEVVSPGSGYAPTDSFDVDADLSLIEQIDGLQVRQEHEEGEPQGLDQEQSATSRQA